MLKQSKNESVFGDHVMTCEEFIARLNEANSSDDAFFTFAIQQAKIQLGLSDLKLSRLFGVSRPTVSRWIAGQSFSHPAYRRAIYNKLSHHLDLSRSVLLSDE